MKNILITGGTGFVGSKLIQSLIEKDPDIGKIFVATRSKLKAEEAFKGLNSEIVPVEDLAKIAKNTQIDMIVNLAGAPIADKRWSNHRKTELRQSRINTTEEVIKLIDKLNNKPEVLINASAVGFYGSQDANEQLDEDSKPQEEFTHFLCKDWENEAMKAEKYGVRVCITRFGIVLGKNGGALKKMLTPFKFGLGGKIASGEQAMSWIHIEDVVRGITFLMNSENLNGSFNFSSPNAVTNKQFTKALAKAVSRPAFFDMPLTMTKILFGEMGEVLLAKGQNVYPRKLLESGFNFRYRRIDSALRNIID